MKDSSATMRFIEWEERTVSHDRGCKIVNYVLKDRNGHEVVAVTGTEKSARHMVYVVCDEFLPFAGLDKTANSKWRTRREVENWLSSLLPKSCSPSPCRSNSHGSGSPHVSDDSEQPAVDMKQLRDSKRSPTDVFWIGSSWTCRKRLKHYRAFRRNGITISMLSFVFVMSEEKEHHIAYIEDMYEDKKQRKKLRIRWFHKTSEITEFKIPPPLPHPREVFFTHIQQVISVECVDGLATVLCPEHFEKVSESLESLDSIHLCSRQFDSNDGIKPLNITEVEGYWQQRILVSMGISGGSRGSSGDLEDDEDGNCVASRGTRSARYGNRRADKGHSNSSSPSTDAEGNSYEIKIGDKVEILCRDSGVRGCWFRGTLIGKFGRRMCIRYDDLRDEDGKGCLEETVVMKYAESDKLGMHSRRRPTIRPCPPGNPIGMVYSFGCPVDVWWNDGWWEGVVISRNSRSNANQVRVYFPDEGDTGTFNTSDLRISRDWVNNQWVMVKVNMDTISTLDFGVLFGGKQLQQSLGYANKDMNQGIDADGYANRDGYVKGVDRFEEQLLRIAEVAEVKLEQIKREECDNAEKLSRVKTNEDSKKRCYEEMLVNCKHSKEASVDEFTGVYEEYPYDDYPRNPEDCPRNGEEYPWNPENGKKARLSIHNPMGDSLFGGSLRHVEVR